MKQSFRNVLFTCTLTILMIIQVIVLPSSASIDFGEDDYTQACTIFTVSNTTHTYFGNSEDPGDLPTYMVAYAAGEMDTEYMYPEPHDPVPVYGSVFFGVNYSGYLAHQGGINTEGLCFDGNGLPDRQINSHPERTPWIGNIMKHPLLMCASVSEVIDFFNSHDFPQEYTYGGQYHFADVSGDAVVVSIGSDGEWAFSRKGNSDYLVSTNFNLADHDHGDYPCQRYETATAMLDRMCAENDVSLDRCRDILSAVHLPHTMYANVFDIISGDIYLYYQRDYTTQMKLNVDDELSLIPGNITGFDAGIPFRAYNLTVLFDNPGSRSVTHIPIDFAVPVLTGILVCSIFIIALILTILYRKRIR